MSRPARIAAPLSSPWRLARPVVADGTLEAVKWLALLLMTLDHTNKFIFAEKLPVVFELGRVSMPLFAFVLAYNLARPGAMQRGAYGRTIRRLLMWGSLSTPVFVALVGWWPLNILFMLALSASICILLERGSGLAYLGAAALFVVAGAFVEFWWPAVALCVATWAFCREPTPLRLSVIGLCLAALWVINRNHWALASLAVVLVLSRSGWQVPRLRGFFYAYYPAAPAGALGGGQHGLTG